MTRQSIDVIPGIFEKDFTVVEKRARLVSPFVNWIQVDIADNKLVPNSSLLDPQPFKKLIIETKINYELHMMIENPFDFADAWIDAGFKRLLFHIESITDFSLLGTQIIQYKNRDVEIGLAVDKQTAVDVVFPFLNDIDCILVMTIAAGFSGQQFIPELLDKVKAIRAIKPQLPIEVDGGINYETAKLAVSAGVTRLVSTSTIFNSPNIQEAIEKLKQTE